MSSTSWTPDEDFSILLSSLRSLDDKSKALSPFIVCVVTGKGPQKAMYEKEIKKMKLKKVHIMTVWLEPSDYPILVGSADLGVCLHLSTSGVDLPMKVVDMFGCGVPVAAVGFPCLGELVVHGKNGMVFQDSRGLEDILSRLFWEGSDQLIERLREGVRDGVRWEENWNTIVKPLLDRLIDDSNDWRRSARMLTLAFILVLLSAASVSFDVKAALGIEALQVFTILLAFFVLCRA